MSDMVTINRACPIGCPGNDGGAERIAELEAKLERLREELEASEEPRPAEAELCKECERAHGDQLSKALDRADAAEAKLERLREATCGHCGRDLPPDGDCYGCEADRLRADIERLKEERVIHREPVVGDRVIVAHWSDFDPSDPVELGTLSSIENGYFYIFGSSRAWRHCKFISTIDGEED